MIGRTISHYKVIEKLGGGGMGVVYKAQDLKLDRFVALKFLPPELTRDEESKQRFIHEAKAASALEHNNICNIHEIDETDDGQIFIVMSSYEGETLKKKIERGSLNIEQTIEITIQIAEGLVKAHESDIIHRDIKPANIFITNDGVVKILDFGLAKVTGQTQLTQLGTTIGTVSYMSPEQTKGEEVDNRTDIWSLGVVFYEMLSGTLPFKGDYDQAILYSILNEEIQIPEDIPAELNEIIPKMLAKNSDERYQEIEHLNDDLKLIRGKSDSSLKISNHRFRLKDKRLSKLKRFILYPVFLIVILVAGYFTVQALLSKVIEPVPIAVISFKNQTGDPSYDYLQKVIPNLLITGLEQSKFFHVNTWERMGDLLEQAGLENVDYIDVDVGLQLSKMDNIPAIVTGSITKIGEWFSIDVKILDTDTKEILNSAKSKGEGENSILKSQIDNLIEQIAVAIELPEKKFAETQKPLIEVTTNSLKAYRYYILGKENYTAFNFKEAIDYLAKAVLIDSTFAMAHSLFALVSDEGYSNNEMDAHLDMAMKYRYKITHKEQILLDDIYAELKRLDRSKSIRELKKAIFLYPKEKEIFRRLGHYYTYKRERDTAIYFYKKVLDLDPNDRFALNRIGYQYIGKGDYTKALEYFQGYAGVAPNEPNPYDSMGEVYLIMNDYTKSIEMYEKALKIKPDFSLSHIGIASNFIKMCKYQKARDHLNKWSEIASSYYDRKSMHYRMATTYMAEGDLENTLKEMENIGNLAKQKSDTFSLAQNQFTISGILYENNKIKEAEEKLSAGKKLLESTDLTKHEKYTLWRYYIWHSTRIAIKKGNIDQAKEYAEMYKKKVGKTEYLYLLDMYFTLSGMIAYAEENYDKAISFLKQSNLRNAFESYHLALAYIKIGDETNTIKNLESAVNYNHALPSNINSNNEIARGRAEKLLNQLKEIKL